MDGAGLTGKLIDGRYRVGPVIGAGGFGTVYEAVHVGLSSKVALKVPRLADVSPAEGSRRIATFLEEGRLLKRLRHPGIVTALDVGLLPADDEGRALPYLVLEWCDGVTLKAWLARRTEPLGRDAAWALLRPAFEAIGHAHDHGVVHRDIKPANVLLEEPRPGVLIPRVIDFGVAKVVTAPPADPTGQTRTTSDSPAYTPRYASPEQLVGLRSGPASDVYALALVLLETVLGRPVFESNDAARAAIAEADLPTPQKLGVDLGPWNDVLERALSWRAADRQPDANALVRALDGAPSRPIPSQHPPAPSAPPARRLSTPPPERRLHAPSTPPPPRAPTAPADDASVTSNTGARRAMAFKLVEIEGRKIYLALHTQQAPSNAEWRRWTTTLEQSAKADAWNLASSSNLVLTDGGAPNTAQRTVVNVLISQAKTLPPVALVTGSGFVRLMVRAFSIFNPHFRVFAPSEIVEAAAHVGVARDHVAKLLVQLAHLEAEELGAGAVETLTAASRVRI